VSNLITDIDEYADSMEDANINVLIQVAATVVLAIKTTN